MMRELLQDIARGAGRGVALRVIHFVCCMCQKQMVSVGAELPAATGHSGRENQTIVLIGWASDTVNLLKHLDNTVGAGSTVHLMTTWYVAQLYT